MIKIISFCTLIIISISSCKTIWLSSKKEQKQAKLDSMKVVQIDKRINKIGHREGSVDWTWKEVIDTISGFGTVSGLFKKDKLLCIYFTTKIEFDSSNRETDSSWYFIYLQNEGCRKSRNFFLKGDSLICAVYSISEPDRYSHLPAGIRHIFYIEHDKQIKYKTDHSGFDGGPRCSDSVSNMRYLEEFYYCRKLLVGK